LLPQWEPSGRSHLQLRSRPSNEAGAGRHQRRGGRRGRAADPLIHSPPASAKLLLDVLVPSLGPLTLIGRGGGEVLPPGAVTQPDRSPAVAKAIQGIDPLRVRGVPGDRSTTARRHDLPCSDGEGAEAFWPQFDQVLKLPQPEEGSSHHSRSSFALPPACLLGLESGALTDRRAMHTTAAAIYFAETGAEVQLGRSTEAPPRTVHIALLQVGEEARAPGLPDLVGHPRGAFLGPGRPRRAVEGLSPHPRREGGRGPTGEGDLNGSMRCQSQVPADRSPRVPKRRGCKTRGQSCGRYVRRPAGS
jgi:hypothetical protein